ncbi:MAG: hypothetical protein WBA13_11290 [Microcoleaceae cyanobacterium]
MTFPLSKTTAATAYDIVCEFKYKVGDQPWVWEKSSGTTPMIARKEGQQRIEFLKKQAEKAGLSFESVSRHCE